MYQAWPWGGTASAASPTAGFVQPPASNQVAAPQWPLQYAVTPEMQQQWAAWASQAQYAYPTNVPAAEAQTTTAYTGAYPDYQTATVASGDAKNSSETKNDANTEKPKTAADQEVKDLSEMGKRLGFSHITFFSKAEHKAIDLQFLSSLQLDLPSEVWYSQFVPQDLAESEKLKQLKEQAEKWTSLQQPVASSWSYSTAATNAATSGGMTTVTAPNVSAGALASTNVTQSGIAQQVQMTKEEEEFEKQFKDWEKQFEAWKQQNQNHPDKEAFAQYEKQWQEWREQLLQKKEQMQRAKGQTLASPAQATASMQASTAASVMSTSTNGPSYTDTTAATTTTPGMYYQHPQYMYMQPYMYPGAAPVAPGAAVVPPAVLPPAVAPPAVVPPVGVPPVSMPPSMMPPTGVPPQNPYNALPAQDGYNQQPRLGMPGSGDAMSQHDMNYDNQRGQDYGDRDMYNYGPGQRNGPRDDGMGQQNYEGFDNPNMNNPNMNNPNMNIPNMNMGEEGDFGRDSWKFNRGRGRGARSGRGGRGRGRESRWGEPTDMDRAGGAKNQRKTLLPGGPGTFPEDDGPPPFEYPTEDCRDQFGQESGQFPDDMQGPGPNNPDDGFYPNEGSFPPQEFNEKFGGQEFGRGRFPPDRKRQFPQDDRFPSNERFPPRQDRFPPGQEGRFPPEQEGPFPPGPEGRFPPDQEGGQFPPDQEGGNFPPDQEDGNFPPEQEGGRFPPGGPEGGRFPPGGPEGGRFPPGGPEGGRFPPGGPEGGRFPPGGPEGGRFPPGGPEGGRFPPGGPEGGRFPPGGPEGSRFPPGGPEGGRFPPGGPEGGRFPPGGPEKGRFQPGGSRGGRFPPGQKGRFPPDKEGEFPPGQEEFPPERFPDQDRFPPEQERFPPDEGMFSPDQERFPPGGPKSGRFPPEDDRFPLEGDRFPPEDDRFPPENERFLPDDQGFPMGRDRFPPPRHMMDERFPDRNFDQFPPEDEMYGPPSFRDDFPPFDERGPRGRGRFRGRGGRFRGDFDRFGPPPFPQRMGDEPFGPPDFPPDDGFGFPGEGPSRMPHPRGRPPFDGPQFGGPGGRFPEDRFFNDGPSRFKSIDYTHRPAAAVMGDDFNPHYEFEGEFQDDVNAYRDNFSSGVNLAPSTPLIFSQVNIESFDYGHGMKAMTSTTIEGKENFKDIQPVPLMKGFDDPFARDRSPLYRDKNFHNDRHSDFQEREPFRERERNRDRDLRHRDRDRSRERNRESDRDRDRSRDRDRKENRDNRDRERDSYDKDRGSYDKDRGKERDRDSKRDRDWDSDQKRDRDNDDKRYKWSKNRESERDFSKDKIRSSSNSKKEIDMKTEAPCQFKPQPGIFKNGSGSETVLIEDILVEPKRSSRPKQLVIILRGLPGSGKTYFAKLIKDKEIENGGSAPRILSLDDYFMVEKEVTETDPDTGKRINRKEFKFEYESGMEETYRSSLFKSFKKTIDDRFFPFIIVDAVHEKSKQYEQYWSYAKQKGFQVYIAEMDCKDPVICHKRNIHNRTLEDINKILKQWESKPRHFIAMDVRSLLQDVAITEVEMEVESSEKPSEDAEDPDEDSEESNPFLGHEPSKWEKLEATEEKLDQLDGLRVSKKKHSSMEDYLQLPDDYDDRKCEPGKKRVRWADLEQRKEQDRLRAIGFVVGQTDWTKLTDPTQADKALTKTKYF